MLITYTSMVHVTQAGFPSASIVNLAHLYCLIFKVCIHYFYQIFVFPLSDSPLKTMKNAFYFIEKALFVLEIFKFLYFHLPLFFSLSAIALEDD